MATSEIRAGMRRFSSAHMCLYWGCNSLGFLCHIFRSSFISTHFIKQLYMYSQSGDIPLSPGDIPGALSIRTLMDGVTDLGLNQKICMLKLIIWLRTLFSWQFVSLTFPQETGQLMKVQNQKQLYWPRNLCFSWIILFNYFTLSLFFFLSCRLSKWSVLRKIVLSLLV